MTAVAAVAREADTLVFRGALGRAVVSGLWRQAQPLRAGLRRLDLTAVSQLDSAGLALLAALAGDGLDVSGSPPGLAELRAAYRLDERLAFAS
jgi:phospholipid transport system transporter-binding protein